MRTKKQRLQKIREIFTDWEEYKLNLKGQHPKEYSKLEKVLSSL